jgi:two-component system, NarL family, sensor histidine kinase BarA
LGLPACLWSNHVLHVFLQVMCDGIRLSQVTANFLSNARKFSPPHTKIIFLVALEKAGRDECLKGGNGGSWTVGRLKMSVIDQGVGISPQDMKKVFQPYSQIRAGMYVLIYFDILCT